MNREFRNWKKDFDENGFVIVENLLDADALETLRERVDKITREHTALPADLAAKLFFERQHVRNNPHWYEGVMMPEDCGDAIRQIDDLPLFDPAFADLVCHERLLDALENLFESAEFSFTMMGSRNDRLDFVS
jgi:hypothetical protein